MQIAHITKQGYLLDGGTIVLEFLATDGSQHHLRFPVTFQSVKAPQGGLSLFGWFWKRRKEDQDRQRIRVFSFEWDGRKQTDRQSLLDLRDILSDYQEKDRRESKRLERSSRMIFGSPDIQEYMTTDEVGQEQLLTKWAIERIDTQLSNW